METLHDTRCWLIYLYESGLFTPKQLYQFLEELKYTDLVQAVHHLLVRTKREELFYRWQAKYPIMVSIALRNSFQSFPDNCRL